MKKLSVLLLLTGLFIVGCGTSETETEQTLGDSEAEVSLGNEGTGETLPPLDDLDENSADTVDTLALLEKLNYEVNANVKDETVTFDMSLQNTSTEQMQLGFSSGQQFEIVVRSVASNEELFRYSEGMMFTQALVYEDMNENETLTWTYDWEYGDVPSNELVATVTLLPMSVNNSPIEANPFDKDVSFTIENNCDDCEEEENGAFRNLEVTGTNGNYTVTGEARVFEAQFAYHVEDGHQILIEETFVTAEEGAPRWSPFELKIQLDSSQLPMNGTVSLFLYERSAKDGSITNEKSIPLESFN